MSRIDGAAERSSAYEPQSSTSPARSTRTPENRPSDASVEQHISSLADSSQYLAFLTTLLTDLATAATTAVGIGGIRIPANALARSSMRFVTPSPGRIRPAPRA